MSYSTLTPKDATVPVTGRTLLWAHDTAAGTVDTHLSPFTLSVSSCVLAPADLQRKPDDGQTVVSVRENEHLPRGSQFHWETTQTV